MRNLILFIWKYHFTFLFIGLEVLALTLLSTNNTYQRTRMHRFSLAISGSVFNFQDGFARYVNLDYENEVLRQQNALLENELFERSKGKTAKRTSGDFEVLPAVVISSSYHQSNNYIIINAGSEDGIVPEMGVQGTSGIVGVVTHVSDHYAAVMPIIHSQTRVSCRLAKNDYFGLLKWDGTDHEVATLEDIPNHVEIDSGDAIVTRGSSGIFPRGLAVGHAIETEKNPSTGFQSVSVRLATNFQKLNTAFVIQNQLKPELDSLQTVIESDEQ